MSCFWIVLSSALLLSPKVDFIAGSVQKPLALKAQIISFLFRWHQFYRTDYNRRAGRYFLLSFSFLCIFPLADPMIREICKDETFLAQKAAPATAADLGVAQDLMETLIAHKDGCVGMAANMIGVNKRIIAFENDGEYMVMFNPVIVKQSGAYETDEGCLSLTGTRKTKRHKVIKVQRQNEKFQTRLKTFTGWTAEIIQHEIDHCEGILI